MSFNRFFNVLIITVALMSMVGCLEQYDPTHNKKMYETEYNNSKDVPAKLTEKGELPVQGAVVTIDVKYANFCSSCHGAAGMGDGPAGAALVPKPRNFKDSAWQAATSDERIYGVIKNGGSSVGLAAIMGPWGSVLSDAEIKEMVQFVRSFK